MAETIEEALAILISYRFSEERGGGGGVNMSDGKRSN